MLVVDTGRWVGGLLKHGFEVYGVDISEGMLEVARQKFSNVKFFRADIRKLPLSDNYFDLIICSLVLIHNKNLEDVLQNLIGF